MHKSFSLIILFLFLSFSNSNTEKIKLDINKHYSDAKVDNLGNFYFVYDSKLIKIDPVTKKKYEYSNPLYGPIENIDIQNPLRILVYHKESNNIIYLSKFFEEIGEAIDLNLLGFYNVQIVKSSNLNGFWILDKSNDKVTFIDNKLNEKYESQPLKSLGINDEINQIIVNSSQLILTTKNSIVFFDRAGNFISRKYFDFEKLIYIDDKKTGYINDNQIIKTDYRYSKFDTVYKFIENNNEIFEIQNNNLYIFRKDSIIIKNFY